MDQRVRQESRRPLGDGRPAEHAEQLRAQVADRRIAADRVQKGKVRPGSGKGHPGISAHLDRAGHAHRLVGACRHPGREPRCLAEEIARLPLVLSGREIASRGDRAPRQPARQDGRSADARARHAPLRQRPGDVARHRRDLALALELPGQILRPLLGPNHLPTRSAQFSYFFFQAEDGIRDYKVTGVQTCALPISVHTEPPEKGQSAAWITRPAICVESRQGKLFVFMPPVEHIRDYLDLVAAIEDTAAYLEMPVLPEGYTPPSDMRINVLKVTPDPGVIEVNIHPAGSWDELTTNTTTLYELARQSRLGTEKFMLDGQHSGTGGGMLTSM